MFERITSDQYYLEIAAAVSKKSTCLRRQYGAVIVKNNEIISTGYNGSPRGLENCVDANNCLRIDNNHNCGNYTHCRSVHAEMNAIISASRQEMIDSTLYLVGFENGIFLEDICPCALCKRLIINAGIKTIITKNTTYIVKEIKNIDS